MDGRMGEGQGGDPFPSTASAAEVSLPLAGFVATTLSLTGQGMLRNGGVKEVGGKGNGGRARGARETNKDDESQGERKRG